MSERTPFHDYPIPVRLAERLRREIYSPTVLSEREIDVLALAANGYNCKQIAERLSLSHWTVLSHYKRLRAKLNARNMQHAVALALVQNHLDHSLVA